MFCESLRGCEKHWRIPFNLSGAASNVIVYIWIDIMSVNMYKVEKICDLQVLTLSCCCELQYFCIHCKFMQSFKIVESSKCSVKKLQQFIFPASSQPPNIFIHVHEWFSSFLTQFFVSCLSAAKKSVYNWIKIFCRCLPTRARSFD